MRPPEFTGGNAYNQKFDWSQPCFNEAAGIHRRKPPGSLTTYPFRPSCFNEAAGIHRRKHEYEGRESE